jgi:cell division protein FtsL
MMPAPHTLQTLGKQRGFTLWTLVSNGFVLAVVLIFALRVAPEYMTYMTVKDVIQRAGEDFNQRDETLQDLRIKIAKLMRSSQVYDVKADDIKVYRERGTVFIDARYEARFPLFWIIEGVMKFDDLVVEAGNPEQR